MTTTKIVYNPAQGDPQTTVWMGQTFIAGKEVETLDIALIERAKTNPFFIVDGVDLRAQLAEAAEKKSYDEARATIVSIDERREQLERQQVAEVNRLEAEHQRARDDFENANDPSLKTALAVIAAHDHPTLVTEPDLPLPEQAPGAAAPAQPPEQAPAQAQPDAQPEHPSAPEQAPVVPQIDVGNGGDQAAQDNGQGVAATGADGGDPNAPLPPPPNPAPIVPEPLPGEPGAKA